MSNNPTYVYVVTVQVPATDVGDDTDTDLRIAMEDALNKAIPNREIVVTFEDVV